MKKKSNHIKTLVIVIFIALFSIPFQYSSQNTYLAPKKFQIVMKVSPNDTTLQTNDTAFKSTTVLIAKGFVLLVDTINVFKIHLRLGTTDSIFNLLNKNFVFNVQGNFQDGTSYQREGKLLKFGLGNYNGLNNFYGEVKIEYNQNHFSNTLSFKNRKDN
jgi:hypothetical protein